MALIGEHEGQLTFVFTARQEKLPACPRDGTPWAGLLNNQNHNQRLETLSPAQEEVMFNRNEKAVDIMRRANPNMMVHTGDLVTGIEDHLDEPGGKMYRLEYQSTPDGRKANAWVRYNPHGGAGNPTGGVSYIDGHVSSDGHLCLLGGATSITKNSPYNLDFAIKRARFWCTAFSAYKTSGDPSVFKV